MSTTNRAVDWHDARDLSHRAPKAKPAERIVIADAVGRVLAQPLTALCDVPHYVSSAMDGWAVAGEPPWRLTDHARLSGSEAVPIVTGGLVPDGARAVLRSESGVVTHGTLTLAKTAEAGEPRDGMHIRPAGEEAHSGETIYETGTRLNPAHIAVAAVCGHDTLSVSPKPRVRLIFTGDEVVTSGIPAPGHVRDTFGVQFHALLDMLGASVIAQGRLPDRLDLLTSALTPPRGEPSADLVITTGGTGHSSADHLREALSAHGARLLIDGVAMRPGGPSVLAELDAGRFLVGLPGNPLAALIGVFTLVQPLLNGLQGAPAPATRTVRLGTALSDGRGRARLIPFRRDGDLAFSTRWRGSGMLRGLAEASGVLVCPADGADVGDELEYIPLPWSL